MLYNTQMFENQSGYKNALSGRLLTKAEVAAETKRIHEWGFVGCPNRTVFYTSSSGFLYPLLPNNCVSCTTGLPLRIAPRPGFETGVLRNGEDYIRFVKHCNPRTRVLESVEELVDYLNEINATPRDPDWLNSMRGPTTHA